MARKMLMAEKMIFVLLLYDEKISVTETIIWKKGDIIFQDHKEHFYGRLRTSDKWLILRTLNKWDKMYT